jgi:small GTP-binding protein
MEPIEKEISRRRTFAIISHPDAGKTTLTEKFLLYGGAVQLAGSVTGRKNQRATTSDWMELERQRGISISSTVLQFEYRGYCVNLLDTPGHKDFSEDTYRVLTAVDAAVMVIDAGKGIEAQTRKLFEVCRMRGIPIFTFMNKLDRPTRDPLALLDELESVLGIAACPINWPLGNGSEFRGVFDRQTRQVHFFERVPGGEYRVPVSVHDLSDPAVREEMLPDVYARVVEELEMLEGAGATFDHAEVLAGKLTPVFFGSAVNNFGVQLLLDAFLELAPPPRARSVDGRVIRRNSRASPVSFSKFRRTWTQNTATDSRSFASAPENSSATCQSFTRARARNCGFPVHTSCSDASARLWMKRIPAMWSDWWVMANFGSATRSRKMRHSRITRFRASRPSASPGCKARARRSSNVSAKVSNNSSRKAWYRRFRFATPASVFRCLALWVRCNSKWCSTGCNPNTARSLDSNRHPGKFCAGRRPSTARDWKRRSFRLVLVWPSMSSAML